MKSIAENIIPHTDLSQSANFHTKIADVAPGSGCLYNFDDSLLKLHDSTSAA
jgi:hypothetical protein